MDERDQVGLRTTVRTVGDKVSLSTAAINAENGRKWYAVFTLPRNEKSVVKHLDVRKIESFLPTYEAVRVWKNRQRMNVVLPLFPTYLFVHINSTERTNVLQSPGVLQIVGNAREGIPLPDSEVEFLRCGFCRQRFVPYPEFAIGERVRIRGGAMQGIQGILVRKNNSLRFVLSVELINQHAAIEVDEKDLELVVA